MSCRYSDQCPFFLKYHNSDNQALQRILERYCLDGMEESCVHHAVNKYYDKFMSPDDAPDGRKVWEITKPH